MSGFIYRGLSTENIIGTPLILASFDGSSNVIGTETEQITGETTVTRFIPNEYGVKKNRMEINYGLLKENGKSFTVAEQIIIERWLTSPKFSSDLITFDNCTGEQLAVFCGIFTHTEWIPGGDGFIGLNFTFMNNHPYAKKHYEYKFSIVPPDPEDENAEVPEGMIIETDDEDVTHYIQVFQVNCPSDELEEYVYPVIKIEVPENGETVKIIQRTDNQNYIEIKPKKYITTVMDCEHCLLRNDETTMSEILNFSDVGLGDVGNIYWMRLLPGINNIRIESTGECSVEISFNAPDKTAGGMP